MKRQYVLWAVGGLAIVLACFLILSPSTLGVYALFWSASSFKRLFYEDAQLSDALSSVLSVLFSVVYALAFASFGGWGAWKLFARKGTPAGTAKVVTAYLLVFAIFPAVHLVVNTWVNPTACFNQRTGEPTKWYVVEADGSVTLYDTGGFDKLGRAKLPATQQACAAFARLEAGKTPHPVIPAEDTRYFDPATGGPLLWYARDTAGTLRFFDGEGFDAKTGAVLLPVTRDVVTEDDADRASDRVKTSEASTFEASQASVASEASQASIEALSSQQAAAASAEATKQLVAEYQVQTLPPAVVLLGPIATQRNDLTSRSVAEVIASVLQARGLAASDWPSTIPEVALDRIAAGDLSDISASGLGEKLTAGALLKSARECKAAVSLVGVISCVVTIEARLILDRGKRFETKTYTEVGAGATAEAASENAIRLLVQRHPQLLIEFVGELR